MNAQTKTVFWFEDDSHGVKDHIESLKKNYQVESGASWDIIRKKREQPINLVIIDFMIHALSSNEEGEDVENIRFDGINWTETGLGFLQRIRQGEYAEYGFDANVPIIAATAVVTYPARTRAEEVKINGFLVKPFSFDELKIAVEKCLL